MNYCAFNWGTISNVSLLDLTRFFLHKCCLRRTRVFTTSIQGTQAKAITTKSDCMPIYIFGIKREREKNIKEG